MNKKNFKILIVVGIIIILFILLVLSSFFFSRYFKKQDEKLFDKIKNSYSTYVYLDGNIYNSKYDKVGEGKLTVVLEKIEDNFKEEYFKIKDSDYYVKYTDIKKCNNNILALDISNYQSIIKIKTKKDTTLYNDNGSLKLFDEKEFDVIISYDDKYLVRYLFQDFYVDKDSILDNVESQDKYKEKIPVLKFNNISDECFDTLCLTYERFDEFLNILKSKGIHTLTSEEYQFYLEKKLYFKDSNNLVILVYDKDITNISELLKKYNVNLVSEIKGNNSVKEFLVTDSFNTERIENMINLKDIKVNIKQKVPVLNYHFFYNEGSFNTCGQSICISDKLFKEHLDYMIDNNYYILRMSEYIDFLYGRISIPEKSVLLTVDDGAMGSHDILPKILDEYKVPVTLFLISGWWELEKYQTSKYLEIYSHGHDLHHRDYCNKNDCGVKTFLLSKEELLNDLNASSERLGTKKAFCYPFYASNSAVRKTVEEAGFQVAFGGGNIVSTMNSDKYNLPRFVIYNDTSVDKLKKMLTN